jgi:hypothetical protein
MLCLQNALAYSDHNISRSFGDEVSEGKVERRGFKSSLLTTARGFGKRSAPINHFSEER